jgi:hypothetical protein
MEQNTTFAAPRDVTQGETHKRLGHRQSTQHIADRLCLGPVRPQEFEPCRSGEEKIAKLDHGTGRRRRRLCYAHPPARDAQAGSLMAQRARGQRKPPHSPQGRQSFAPETESVNLEKIRAVDS